MPSMRNKTRQKTTKNARQIKPLPKNQLNPNQNNICCSCLSWVPDNLLVTENFQRANGTKGQREVCILCKNYLPYMPEQALCYQSSLLPFSWLETITHHPLDSCLPYLQENQNTRRIKRATIRKLWCELGN